MAGFEACLTGHSGVRGRGHRFLLFFLLSLWLWAEGTIASLPSPVLPSGLLSLAECLRTLTSAPSPHPGPPLLSTQVRVRPAPQWPAAWRLPLLVPLVSPRGCA